MKKTLLYFLLFLFSGFQLFAQQSTIKGRIISADDNLGLPGVSVYVKGNISIGTTSDLDGNYILTAVSPTDILVFSYIGFQNQEILINNQKVIDVLLKLDLNQLDEVVVTALGIKRQIKAIGYSTQEVSGLDIELSNTPNIVNALSGKSAGILVMNSNGVDGGTTRITIRGNNNIGSNNQPLFVIDGIPLENDPGFTDIGRGQDWGSAINNINAYDIENINILKGPTASALYGSRGANGVILITTKKGHIRDGIGVDYNFSHKIVQPYYYRDVQNKYGAGSPLNLLEPAFLTDEDGNFLYPAQTHTDDGPYGLSTAQNFGYYGSSLSWGSEMLGQMVKWWDGEMRPYSPQPNNLSIPFHNGSTQAHNISMSGGSKMGTFRLSLTRQDHQSIVDNSKFDQTTINFRTQLNVSEKLTTDISFSYIDYNRLNSPQIGESNGYSKALLYSWPRSWKGLEREFYENIDGTYNNWGGNYPFQYISKNTWWDVYNNNTELNRNKLIGSIAMTYDMASWLSITARVGLDNSTNQFETKNKPWDILGLQNGKYSFDIRKDNVLNNEFFINMNQQNIAGSKFSVNVVLGGSLWERSSNRIWAQSGKWIDPWTYSILNFEDANNHKPAEEYRYKRITKSLFGIFNLNYDDYIFLELTNRNDITSTLPNESNSYNYPSASLSFIPVEAFKLNIPWLSYWKIRGAAAQTASDQGVYKLDFTYNTGNYGGQQYSVLPNEIPPFNLKPQWAWSYEFGTNFALFDNRLDFDFTYYYINSYSQLLSSPLPISSGASTIRINTGEIENKGVELIMKYAIINENNFTVETGLNFARNRNNIISLGEGAEIYMLGNIWGLNGPAIAVREGEEYGTIIGYDYVYHENGQPILNDEGTQYLVSPERVSIGNASPDFIAGWNCRFRYKNLTLTTLIDMKWGGDIYSGSYVIGLQSGQSPETLYERDGNGLPFTDPDGNVSNIGVILPGVYADGSPNDKVVHYYYKYMPNAGGWGHFLSGPGILENSWIKFRDINLSYRLSEKLINKIGFLQDISIYISGRDLFYLYSSLPDRINPEGVNGSGNAQGLEWAAFPGTRTITFGLKASL